MVLYLIGISAAVNKSIKMKIPSYDFILAILPIPICVFGMLANAVLFHLAEKVSSNTFYRIYIINLDYFQAAKKPIIGIRCFVWVTYLFSLLIYLVKVLYNSLFPCFKLNLICAGLC